MIKTSQKVSVSNCEGVRISPIASPKYWFRSMDVVRECQPLSGLTLLRRRAMPTRVEQVIEKDYRAWMGSVRKGDTTLKVKGDNQGEGEDNRDKQDETSKRQ